MNRPARSTGTKKPTGKMLVAVIVIAAGLSSRAMAFEPVFGDPGTVAVSLERLSGYAHTTRSVTTSGIETSQSVDTFTLFGNGVGAVGSAYDWPRAAVDVFISHNLSLGGALSIFTFSTSTESVNGVSIAPRIGYAAVLGSRATLWPRAGFTYARISSGSRSSVFQAGTASSFFALTLEAPLAILLAPRIGLLVGPTLDLGLGGGSDTTIGGTTTTVPSKATEIGVNAGLLLFF